MTIRYLTKEECKRTKEAAISARDKAIVEVLLHTGMRIGECAGLKVRDFDFEAETVRIERIVVPVSKTIRNQEVLNSQGRNLYKPRKQLGILTPEGKVKKVFPKELGAFMKDELGGSKEFVRVGTKADDWGRVVPLCPKGPEDTTPKPVWRRLDALFVGRDPEDWAWRAGPQRGRVNHWGGRLSYPAIRQVVLRAMERARISREKAHPHTTRHTFAVQYLKAGGDLRSLQRIGGWASITMVAKYLQLIADDLVEMQRGVDLGF